MTSFLHSLQLNYVAILVAIVAAMALGAIYFAPQVVGTVWMRAIGKTPEQLKAANANRMALVWVATVVFTVFMAFTEAVIIAALHARGPHSGAAVGFHLWLGLALPVVAFPFLFEGRSVKNVAITSGHHLVILVAMGAIIGAWG